MLGGLPLGSGGCKGDGFLHVKVVTSTALTVDIAKAHITSADYCVVVLTRGLLEQVSFCEMLLFFDTFRQDDPVDVGLDSH